MCVCMCYQGDVCVSFFSFLISLFSLGGFLCQDCCGFFGCCGGFFVRIAVVLLVVELRSCKGKIFFFFCCKCKSSLRDSIYKQIPREKNANSYLIRTYKQSPKGSIYRPKIEPLRLELLVNDIVSNLDLLTIQLVFYCQLPIFASVCRQLSCSNLLCVNPRDEVYIQIGLDEIPQNHEWHVLNQSSVLLMNNSREQFKSILTPFTSHQI